MPCAFPFRERPVTVRDRHFRPRTSNALSGLLQEGRLCLRPASQAGKLGRRRAYRYLIVRDRGPGRLRGLGLGELAPCASLVCGGADRSRTGDLRLAKPALSQLSYGPLMGCKQLDERWARAELNCRPHAYQACALTT